MAGVLVSNGEDVVRSQGDGSYVLRADVGEHAFVWVTVPQGYRATGPFYRAVSEPGAEMNFQLTPAPERKAKAFRLVHITDIHLDSRRADDSADLRQDLAQLTDATSPDLVVVSGDLTDSGTLEELSEWHEILTETSLPVFTMFGGHDGKEEHKRAEPGTTSTANYGQVFGPAYYSFDSGGRHFVLYPNEDRYFSPADRCRKSEWLLADLANQPVDREIVVFVHSTPAASFIDELSRFPVTMLLFGHRHSSKIFRHAGIQVVCTPPLSFGGTDSSARGYRLFDFSESGLSSRLGVVHRLESGAIPTTDSSPREIALPAGSLRLAWEHQLPGALHRATPVGWRDAILVSLDDQNMAGAAGVRCLDAATGALRWQTSAAPIKNSTAVDREGHCAVVSVAGRLHVLNAASGEMLWQTDLPGYPERWIYSSPHVTDPTSGDAGVVYAGSNAGYAAFNVETGESLWYTSFVGDASRIIDKPSYTSAVVSADLLIVLVPKRGLVALNLESGELAWECPLGVLNYWSTPVLGSDMLISGGDPRSLIALQPDSGEVLWHTEVLDCEYPSGIAIAGEQVFVTTPRGTVHGCHLATGAIQWTFATGEALLDMVPARRGGSSILGAPEPWSDWLAVGGSDGVLYLLNRANGKCVAKAEFGAPLTAAPCAVGEGLCVTTWDGRVFCYAP